MSGSASSLEQASTVVLAGAGAGKTTELVATVLHSARKFKVSNGRWPRFLVSTFTVKATNELRERFLVESLKFKEDPSILEFSQDKSRLVVGTLHSLFGQLIGDLGHIFGIDSNFAMVDEVSLEGLKQTAAIKTLKTDPKFDKLWDNFNISTLIRFADIWSDAKLTTPEIKAITAGEMAELVKQEQLARWSSVIQGADLVMSLMGVGNGETIKNSDGVGSGNGNQDASKKLSPARAKFIETFASLGDPRVLPDSKFLDSFSIFPKTKSDSDEFVKALDACRSNFKAFKESMAEPNNDLAVIEDAAGLYSLLDVFCSKFVSEVNAKKEQDGLLEFSDLESLLWTAIQQEPEVFREHCSMFDAWFVDEYQDTSIIQDKILSSLAGDSPVYFVGDPQQSIYKFRGAESGILLSRVESFKAGAGTFKSLDMNYRSTPALTSFFNDYFSTFKSKQFRAQTVRDPSDGDPQEVAYFYYQPDETGDPMAPFGERVIELINSGVNPSDIKILGRTRAQLTEAIKFLKSVSVPCSLLSGDDYLNKQEIKDLRSFTIFCVNPWDNKNLIQLLRTPWFFTPDREISAFAMGKKVEFLWTEIQVGLREQESVARLKKYQVIAQDHGVTMALKVFLSESGFLHWPDEFDAMGQFESATFRFLTEVTDRLGKGSESLLKWLRSPSFSGVSEQESQEVVPSLKDGVVGLMTIHASKGLAFDHVILLGAGSLPRLNTVHRMGIVPHGARFSVHLPKDEEETSRTFVFQKSHVDALKAGELEEADRLHYVALTRARKSVSVIWKEPVARESFLDRVSWDRSDGVHDRSGYRCVVRGVPEVATQLSTPSRQDPLPRLPAKRMTLEDIPALRESVVLSETVDALTMQKMLQGSRVHAYLELNSAGKIETNSSFPFGDWLMNLDRPPMRKLFEIGEREWRFSFRVGNDEVIKHSDGVGNGNAIKDSDIASRQVDLWGIVDDVVYIVDYKTGSSRYLEKISQQMSEYKKSFQSMYPEMQVKAYALFVSEKKAIECS